MEVVEYKNIFKEESRLGWVFKAIGIFFLYGVAKYLNVFNSVRSSVFGTTKEVTLYTNLFWIGLFIYIGYKIYKFMQKKEDDEKVTGEDYWKPRIKDILEQSGLYLEYETGKRPPVVRVRQDENDLFLEFEMLVGMSKDDFVKRQELFENMFGMKVLRVQENLAELIFHFRKKEKDIGTDYLYEDRKDVVLGYDVYGDEILWEPLLNPHILIAARAGGGKTSFLHSIVLQLKNKSEELIFVDFKGNEFGPLRSKGYTVHTDMEDLMETMRYFQGEMKKRQDEFMEKGIRDYTEVGLKPSYLIFDEFSELMDSFPTDKQGKEDKKEFVALLGSIARLGRSSGFNILLSIQQPNAQSLPTEIRSNFGQPVAIRGADSTIQTMVFGERVEDIPIPLEMGNHITTTPNGYEIINVPYYNGDFFEDMTQN